MPEDLDLSDVDPLKWAEVRKRVQIVRDYLAMPHPTGADRDRHAALLGLRTGQFYNLVRAWRVHRRPSALAFGVRRIARPSRSRRGGVDPRAREIAREVIAELGRDAPASALDAATAERCAAEGVKPPSRGTIRLLAKEAGSVVAYAPTNGILVARIFVRLPTVVDGAVELPAAALVAEMPAGRILELVMTETGMDEPMDRIASALHHRLAKTDLPVTATEGDSDLLEERVTGLRCMRETTPAVDLLLGSTVGRRIGHIELRSRRPVGDAKVVMQSERDVALSLEDAQMALNIAVRNHNNPLVGGEGPRGRAAVEAR